MGAKNSGRGNTGPDSPARINRWVIVAASVETASLSTMFLKLCSSSLGPMPSVPFDNLRPTGGPYPLMAHHVAKRVIQKADTERLADDPGVQVQDQEPAVLFAVPIQDVKTLL